MNLDPYFTPDPKINLKRYINLKVRAINIKYIQKNIQEKYCDSALGSICKIWPKKHDL